MADEMEDVEAPSPTKTAFTLWMAGSTEEVGQWLLHGAIPLTEHAATWKGQYVGLRDRADLAADRHRQRCRTECKSFDKKDMWLLKIELDLKALCVQAWNLRSGLGLCCSTQLQHSCIFL